MRGRVEEKWSPTAAGRTRQLSWISWSQSTWVPQNSAEPVKTQKRTYREPKKTSDWQVKSSWWWPPNVTVSHTLHISRLDAPTLNPASPAEQPGQVSFRVLKGSAEASAKRTTFRRFLSGMTYVLRAAEEACFNWGTFRVMLPPYVNHTIISIPGHSFYKSVLSRCNVHTTILAYLVKVCSYNVPRKFIGCDNH